MANVESVWIDSGESLTSVAETIGTLVGVEFEWIESRDQFFGGMWNGTSLWLANIDEFGISLDVHRVDGVSPAEQFAAAVKLFDSLAGGTCWGLEMDLLGGRVRSRPRT